MQAAESSGNNVVYGNSIEMPAQGEPGRNNLAESVSSQAFEKEHLPQYGSTFGAQG